MFRNFVDPPSLDRNSLNESQKRAAGHVTRSDQSNGTHGAYEHSDISNAKPRVGQVDYHYSSPTSPQPNGPAQNGGYTTSIYVGGVSPNPRPPQPQHDSQHNQNLLQQQQQQQQEYYYHQHQQGQPLQLNGQVHQDYPPSPSTVPSVPPYLQHQYHHSNGPQPAAWTGQHHPEGQTSAQADTLLVQQRLAAASIHDQGYVNGTASSASGIPLTYTFGPAPGVMQPSSHPSFPDSNYPSPFSAPPHAHAPHPVPSRGHVLNSIQENGLFEPTQDNGLSNHHHHHIYQEQLLLQQQQQQQQQQQLQYVYHQQHQQNHQQQQQQHQQQLPTAKFVPPTMPQQSWGSGWTPPVSASNMAACGAHQKRYNIIPPPPPLTESLFAGRRDVKRPSSVQESQIVSEKGTVRGFRNRVRAGIATFWAQPQDPRNFRQLEQGKIVVYATSMSVVRETSERCKNVRHLLQNHMVRYEERDLYMSREIQQELHYRLKQEGVPELRLPHVFADGIHMGGSEELEKLNEAGELRALLNNYQKITVRIMCEKCGGYRFVPCDVCHGSKRSLLRNHFTEEFCALRCMHCNESGLKRCDLCRDQQE